MNDCDITFETLSAYADGELDAGELQQVEEHLEQCADCRSTYSSVKATKHKVSTLGAHREPTEAMRQQLSRHLETDEGLSSEQQADQSPWNKTRVSFAVAAAAGLLVLGYLVGIKQTTKVPDNWAETFVEDHMHSKPAAKPMDVSGNNPDEIIAYFKDRVDFEPVVPKLPQVELVGGRLCKLAGHRVELLFYRHHGNILSLFIADKMNLPSTCQTRKGHGICVRRRGDLKYMLVGPNSPVELRKLLEGAIGS